MEAELARLPEDDEAGSLVNQSGQRSQIRTVERREWNREKKGPWRSEEEPLGNSAEE